MYVHKTVTSQEQAEKVLSDEGRYHQALGADPSIYGMHIDAIPEFGE